MGFDYQGKTEKHESQRGPSARGAAPAAWGASLRESRVPRVSSGHLGATSRLTSRSVFLAHEVWALLFFLGSRSWVCRIFSDGSFLHCVTIP